MKSDILDTELSGVKLIKKTFHKDPRGYFSKTFNTELFQQNGLNKDWSETFFSISKKNVLRGMHYQKRPFDHEKLVSVTSGSIIDVIVCVDPNSHEYGQSTGINISAESPFSVYISKGYAHGFFTISHEAGVLYQTSSLHSPEHDTGINFDSFGYEWPSGEIIISERDRALPCIGEHSW